MPEFTAQQILRLCTHFHRAFLKKDKGRLVQLAEELRQKRHLLRAAEVSMTLNHFAQLQILDHALWNAFSEALVETYLEPDCKALGLAANAYARAMLQHPESLEFVARQVEALARQREMEVRNVAMIVNGFSKLRLRDANMMTAISEQLICTAHELNAVDLATVANGYARLWLHESTVFDAMKEPMMRAMPDFSVQNLAMVAHAYGRFFRREEDLLEAISLELKKRCDQGQAVPAENLGSIVHAFASRLKFCPDDLLRVVEFSLPRVAKQMVLPDTILTLGALKHMPQEKLRAPEFNQAVFGHCLRQMPKLTSSGIVCVMEAASHLHYDRAAFWSQMFAAGLQSLRSKAWEVPQLTQLAMLLAELQGRQTLDEAILEAMSSALLAPGVLDHAPSELLQKLLEAVQQLPLAPLKEALHQTAASRGVPTIVSSRKKHVGSVFDDLQQRRYTVS